MSVLCLIANPAEPALDSRIVQAIQHETGGEINWLHQRIACEILSPYDADTVAIAHQALAGRPVDVALVPSSRRRKQILIADMDSTMIDQECIDEIADAVGIRAEVAAITARAMNGELDFAEALRTRVALVKGLDRKVIEEIRRERITLAAGGRALVQTMKAYGAYCSLVSGGFTFFANYYAERIGFDEAIANVLVFDGNALAGTVADPIVDKATKLNRLLALAAERDVPIGQTMAVGDGANDLDMIKAAGLGVALHAKPSVAEQATVRIDHGDLTALLYLQGYSDEEFVR